MKIGELEEPAYSEWLAECPECIREMAAKWPLNVLWLLKPTGQRGAITSYAENGTVTVAFPWGLNLSGVEVFGIDPNDLVECDDDSPFMEFHLKDLQSAENDAPIFEMPGKLVAAMKFDKPVTLGQHDVVKAKTTLRADGAHTVEAEVVANDILPPEKP
jgi:hypothetical protein